MQTISITLIKLLSSSLELFVMIMLSFSLFRIPLRFNFMKIFIMGVVVSLITYYLRDVSEFDYAMLLTIICEIVLIMLTFRLLFLYSFLICIIGYLFASIIEYSIAMVGVKLNLTSIAELNTNGLHTIILLIIATIIMLFIVVFLNHKKYGLMLISKRSEINRVLKGYNFLLSGTLLVVLFILQLASESIKESSVHTYVLVIMALLLLTGIYISYRQNKKMLREKYERIQ